MMVARIFILVLLIVGVPCSSAMRGLIPIKTEQSVQILTLDYYGICSGSIVGDGLVLTAAHCIKGEQMVVKFFDHSTRVFDVITKGRPYGGPTDFAFLGGDTRHIPPLKIKRDLEPLPLFTAYISFNPLENIISHHVVHVYKVHPEEGKFVLLFNHKPIGGDSGSPLINLQGEVIGVVVAGFIGTDIGIAASSFFFTPTQSLLKSHTHQ